MKTINLNIIAVSSLVALAGCASSPDDIAATYVSPTAYDHYDCDQISAEMRNISHRTSDLYATLDKQASNDKVATGVGLVLFWPALFLIDGDGPQAQEYARLKGEYQALERVSVQKKCSPETLPPSPEEIIEQKREEEKKEKQHDGMSREATAT